jgi:hypothetical protein
VSHFAIEADPRDVIQDDVYRAAVTGQCYVTVSIAPNVIKSPLESGDRPLAELGAAVATPLFELD